MVARFEAHDRRFDAQDEKFRPVRLPHETDRPSTLPDAQRERHREIRRSDRRYREGRLDKFRRDLWMPRMAAGAAVAARHNRVGNNDPLNGDVIGHAAFRHRCAVQTDLDSLRRDCA